MSTLLSEKSKDVICGYCRHALDYFIPTQVIDICIAFFDVGEEFDTQMSTLPIEGANHTICRVSNGQLGVLFGKNVIAAKDDYIFYHCRLRVSAGSLNFKYNIGIVDHAAMINENELSWTFNSGLSKKITTIIYDLYINFETCRVCLYPEGRDRMKSHSIDAFEKYRLRIQSSTRPFSNTALFEILSFDAAKANDTPLKMALAIDVTSAGIRRKISLFERVLKENPKSFTYCNEYLCCLHIKQQPEKMYDFILEHSRAFMKKCQKMFELIDDESLKELDLMEIKMCDLMKIKAKTYYYLKDYENALKYFELWMANSDKKEIISYCFGCMALVYEETAKKNGENIDKCILLSKRALEYQPNDVSHHSNLGYYYLIKGNYSKSYKHLKKSIEIEPNEKCANENMVNLLYAMKRYDECAPFFGKLWYPEVGPKCLWNYANVLFLHQKYEQSNDLLYQLIQRNDFAQHTNRNEVYWFISLNFEKMGNGKKAMQYAKEAQIIQKGNMKEI